ncbi:LysE family translocator [Catenovulum sp. SM1970]|uniref:LysE family translocator n=1 Tax=Marinifaba aquimaris TaxID=2741323 RepID=UPI00157318B3|nr:LysE family translocator [Marinifaba aquimaris]NTS77152.1 LysE family translocator [Marinifaba aquimaris]
MSVEAYIALIAAMFFVAVLPGPAAFTVTSTSMTSGFKQGSMMTLGIVLADYVFIALALSGLTFIAELLGSAFIIVKYVCAVYLIWQGVRLVTATPEQFNNPKPRSNRSAIVTGFLLTMSNPKAILFYAALFPTFVNLAHITIQDALGIMLCATLVFGSVNLVFAYLGVKATNWVNNNRQLNLLNKTAGSVLMTSGLAIAIRE